MVRSDCHKTMLIIITQAVKNSVKSLGLKSCKIQARNLMISVIKTASSQSVFERSLDIFPNSCLVKALEF